MSLRKQSVAWVLAALCAPGMIQADETAPPSTTLQGLRLQVATQDVIEGAPGGPPGTVTIVSDETPVSTTVRFLLDSQIEKKMAEAEAQGKFWLGLMCTAPTDALRTQLDLAGDVGLLVEEVYDGGPAKKAGLQVHDVLTSATVVGKDDVRSLKNLMDLINVVQAAETNAMKVEFLRRGRKQVLEVVPAERPKQTVLGISTDADPKLKAAWTSSPESLRLRWAGPMIVNLKAEPLPEGMTMEFQPAEGDPEKVIVKKGDQVWSAEVKSLEKLPEEISTLVKQQLQQRHSQVARAFAYRTTMGDNVSYVAHGIASTLPDDVTITTVRKGSAPAKVTLQKGDQSWDVTEKDLAAIPADLRPFAVMALHSQMASPPFTKILAVPVAPGIPPVHVVEPRPGKVATPTPASPKPVPKTVKVFDRPQKDQEIERQLKELAEQVEKLRQAVEKTQPKQ